MFRLAHFAGVLIAVGIVTGGCDQATEPQNAPTIAPPNLAVVTNDRITTPFAVFVPCANGGAGEVVVASDLTLHTLISVTSDAAGGTLFNFHAQPMGGSGVGLVTGDTYRATGVSRDGFTFHSGGLPFEETLIDNFRWIGPARGNNLLVHITFHVTVNENGVVTALVDHSSVECK